MGLLSGLRDQIRQAGTDLDNLRDQALNSDTEAAYAEALERVAERRDQLAKMNTAMEQAAQASVSGVKDLLGGLVTKAQETILITDQMFEDWRRSGSLNAMDQAMVQMEVDGMRRIAELSQAAAAVSEQLRHLPGLIQDGVLDFETLKANTESYITEYIDPMIDRHGELRRQLRENLSEASRMKQEINQAVVELRGADSLQEKIAGALGLLQDSSSQVGQTLSRGLQEFESGKTSAEELLRLVDRIQESLKGLKRNGNSAFDNLSDLVRDIARQAEREDYDASGRGGIY